MAKTKKKSRKIRTSKRKIGKKSKSLVVEKLAKEDVKIITQEKAFATKHPLCKEVAHFYTMPGQLNLVLHGVPFHLIKDQFVRFHAIQSTVIGWKFSIIYTILLFSTLANALLFRGRFVDYVIWAFIICAGIHALINLYLAHKTRNCEEVSLPIVTDAARRISM